MTYICVLCYAGMTKVIVWKFKQITYLWAISNHFFLLFLPFHN